MIKINLARLKTAALGQVSDSARMGGTLASLSRLTKVDVGALRDFPLRPMLIAFLLIFVSDWFATDFKASEIRKMDAAIQKVKTEIARQQAVIAKMAEFERQRVALEKDEFILKSKVTTLKQLRDGREDTARALVMLSRSIPNEMWLESITFRPDGSQITGFATDTNFISDFMKSLEAAPQFGSLDLNETSQKKDDKQILFNFFSIKGTRAAVGLPPAAGGGK